MMLPRFPSSRDGCSQLLGLHTALIYIIVTTFPEVVIQSGLALVIWLSRTSALIGCVLSWRYWNNKDLQDRVPNSEIWDPCEGKSGSWIKCLLQKYWKDSNSWGFFSLESNNIGKYFKINITIEFNNNVFAI